MCNEFCFHPVGQGLFYTGRIGKFVFVYDCGSKQKTSIDRELRQFKRNLSHHINTLQLLIISHFDADHINGLEQLLNGFQPLLQPVTVKEIVLPYLHPEERLIVAARYAIKHDLARLPRSYINFLIDPAAYFGGIFRGRDGPTITYILPGRPFEGWLELEGTAGSANADTGSWTRPEITDAGLPDLEQQKKNYPNIKLRDHSSRYRVDDWIFKFYCDPIPKPPRVIKALSEAKLLVNKLIAPDALTSRDNLEKLKHIYKQTFPKNKQNAISLICCHGPTKSRSHPTATYYLLYLSRHLATEPYCRDYPCLYDYLHQEIQHPQLFLDYATLPQQMLTGDAKIDVKSFEAHFKQEIANVNVFLIPHHGAKDNWRSEFPTLLKNCRLWVVSYGRNGYGHPSVAVSDDLSSSHGPGYAKCNEYCGWRVTIC